jgi:hypothetical protein
MEHRENAMTIQGVRSFKLAVAAALAAAAATLSTAATPLFQAGDQSRWSLDFRVRLEQSLAKPVEIHLSGEWSSTVVATRTGEFDAQLQIGDISFKGDAVDKVSAPALDDLRKRLSRPFWATYRDDGGLLAMHFLRDVSPDDQNLLQMIATELQLTQPASHRPSWTAQERDGAGEYAALYAIPQFGSIVKRKLKYTHTDGAAGPATDALQVAIDESNVVFSLDPNGAIRTVDGTSRMRMMFSPGKNGQLTAVTEIHLGNLHNAKASELIGSLARAEARVVTSPIVTHRPDPAMVRSAADDRLIEGYSTDSLLSAAFSKDSADSALSDRLGALFRRRPEAAQDAVGLLYKDGAQKRITNALGAAGTLDSVSALATLARNQSAPDNLRVDALIAFVQMQHPSAEAMRVPADLLDDPNPSVSSAARMMTGTLARAGRAQHSGEANAMDASLIALYRDAHETKDACELLGALGNSAGPTTIPVVEEALHDSRTAVRAAAARALRLAPGSEVDDLLANVITDDRDPKVRSDAIFATQFRHPMPSTLAEALVKAATNDGTDYVRSNAVALLRDNPVASPDIPETLSRVAESDKNPGIRRQATDALAAISSGASAKP